MESIRPGWHGRASFTACNETPSDEAWRWDVEEAAFVLFGSTPARVDGVDGVWYVFFFRDSENGDWYERSFGYGHEAIFRAVKASGRDTFNDVGFVRVK
jgi:hypothetical protein